MLHFFSGRLDDQYIIRIMKDKLNSKTCRNQGFVLDGFPKTYEQAKELFSGGKTIHPVIYLVAFYCWLVFIKLHDTCIIFLMTNDINSKDFY